MSDISRDKREMLTDIIISSIYGYHCAMTGKEFKNDDAINEYIGKYDFNSTELRLPILKNIVQSAVGEILELNLLNNQ